MKNTSTFRLRQNLALLIKDRKLSAAQLARSTGIAKQVLSDWMAGVQPRKLEHLYVVAQTLNVTIETLCFTDDPLNLTTTNTRQHESSLDEIRGHYEVYLRKISD